MVRALTKHSVACAVGLYLTCLFAASATELVGTLSASKLAIWFPTGFVFAMMVVTPPSKWAWWLTAAIAAELSGNRLWYHHAWGPVILLTLGNGFAALGGAAVFRQFHKAPYFLDNVRRAALFTVVAIGVLPSISATIGSVALGWSYSKAPFDAWTRLMLGDATGAILAAPIGLLLFRVAAPRSTFSKNRKLEAALLAIFFVGMAAVSLGGIMPFVFLMIPLSLWAALSFRIIGAVISNAALTVFTVAFTFAGASPFAQDTISPEFQFTGLQLFILVASTTALLIGAMAEEKRRGLEQLFAANAELNARDAEKSVQLASTEARARETESLLSAISEACPDLIFAKNLKFEMVYANAATLGTLGTSEMAELRQNGEQAYYHHSEEFEAIRRNDEIVISSKELMIVEEKLTGSDGITRVYRSTKAPLYDGDGHIAGLAGVSVDITDMKKAQAREKMLVREVEHRSRNVLAVVHGLAQLTRADTVAELKNKLGKRIGALARTNGAIANSNWQGASLIAILTEELAPYQDENDQRIFLSGDDLLLDPATAQSITLVFHELTTNAAKYGALSMDSGKVEIGWTTRELDGEFALATIDWIESGGPPASPPSAKGFGSALIASFGEERAETGVQFEWKPQGLHVTIIAPVLKPG